MQPAAAVVHAGKIAVVEGMAGEQPEHQPVYHTSERLHEVIDQAISALQISVQESTGDIEPMARECLPDDRFQYAIRVVEARIHWVDRLSRQTSRRDGDDLPSKNCQWGGILFLSCRAQCTRNDRQQLK